MFTPRDWQVEAKRAFDEHQQDDALAMVVAATGAGKTALGHYLAMPHVEAGGRMFWFANRDELVTQPLRSLRKWWPRMSGGLVKGNRKQVSTRVVYASKDTVYNPRRSNPFEILEQMLEHGAPSIVVCDEAHYSASPTWQKLIAFLRERCPEARFLGLTATPDRSDNRRLSDTWEIIYSFPIVRAIDEGVLVPPYAAIDMVPELDLSSVGMMGLDYDQGGLEKELLDKHVIPHTLAALQKEHKFERLPFRDEVRYETPGLKDVVVFTVTIRQAQLTAEALRDIGVKAEAVWGVMPKRKKESILSAYERGEIDALVNADLLTVGWDSPRTRVGVLAKATKAWARFTQILGRMLRSRPGKSRALILDLCGSTRRLSLVSAPVLVDGTDCPESDDGKHSFVPLEGTHEGLCTCCGLVIKCYANRGGHKFVDHFCKYCNAPQCSESPDQAHHWVPWEEGKRICVHCGVEIPDRLCSLVKRSDFEPAPVAWKKLATPGEIWFVGLGRIGAMFNVRFGDKWQPWLHANGKLTPLSPGPVEPIMARMLTDDVASRTKQRNGLFGAQASSNKMKNSCIDAERVAKKEQLWQKRP